MIYQRLCQVESILKVSTTYRLHKSIVSIHDPHDEDIRHSETLKNIIYAMSMKRCKIIEFSERQTIALMQIITPRAL